MADPKTGCSPPCGYGLLGLCCTSCLFGPCRRSPFAEAEGGRACGENSDWIVAHNLLERVLRESLQAMADFRGLLERPPNPENRGGVTSAEEMRLLLSPLFRGESALLGRLYPAKPFPLIDALKFPSGSWSAALLDAAAADASTRRVEALLEDALRLSAMAVAAAALCDGCSGSAQEGVLPPLPETPSPMLILVSDEERSPVREEGLDAPFLEIEAACREKVWIGKLRHVGRLPALGREIYERWGIPASLSRSLVVVASPSVIPGLGALALGFSTASLPGYPLQGSPRVERYLTIQLQERFGHAYRVLDPEGGVGEQILGAFMP